jgi:hypothetical protein
MIKLVRKTPKRGVIEHYYSAQPRQQFSDHAWEETPSIVKAAVLGPTITEISRKLADAANAGGFDRGDVHLSATWMKLDLEGWRAIAKLLSGVIDQVSEIEEATAARLKQKPDAEILESGMVMALFEMQDGAAHTMGPA